MARPKKMDQQEMLALTQQYYAEKCTDNPSLLKYSLIGKYIRSLGYEIEDYLIRRNPYIKEYIEAMRESGEKARVTLVSVYKDLDIDSFMRKNSTDKKLKQAILERENYYKEIAHSAHQIFSENKKLKKTLQEQEATIKKLEALIGEQASASCKNEENYKAVLANNKIMKDIIDTYVYPEIANELLKKQRFLKNTAGYLDPAKVHNGIIKADNNVKEIKNDLIRGLFTSIGGSDENTK